VLARAGVVLDAINCSPVRSRIQVCSRLSNLEQAVRTPVAAIVYEVGCECGASLDEVGRFLSDVTCPVALIPEWHPRGARALARLCTYRERATVFADAPTQLRLDLDDVIGTDARDRPRIVPRMINAIHRSLPEELDAYRIFDVVKARATSARGKSLSCAGRTSA
jgi:hypothetical protein